MSQPEPRQALSFVASEMATIGHRLTELSAQLQAQLDQPSSPEASDKAQTAAQAAAQAEVRAEARADETAPVSVPAEHATGEHVAGPVSPPPPMPAPGPQPWQAPPPAPWPPQQGGPWPGWPVAGQPPPRRSLSSMNWEPSRVLAWIGSAVTLLGVVFLLVLAAQRGWFGPEMRIEAGAALGLLLVGLGLWSHHRPGGKAGGYALAATGFAALYLDAVASTALYHYLPDMVGLGVGLVVAIAGLLLADRWQAQPFALGVVLGCAVCAPMITGVPDARLIAFLLLLQIAAAPSQLRRDWQGLAVAAAIPTILAAVIADLWALQLSDPAATVWAAAIAAVLGVALAVVAAGLRPQTDATAVGTLIASPVPALVAAPLLDRTGAGLLAAGVAALLFAVWGSARFMPLPSQRLSPRIRIAAAGVGMAAVLEATMTLVEQSTWGTVLLCEALVLALGAYLLRSTAALIGATCYAALGFLVAQFHEIPPAMLFNSWNVGENASGVPGVLGGLLVAVVAVALAAVGIRIASLPQAAVRLLWMIAGVLLLYGMASATMALVLLIHADRTSFLIGHTAITLSWVVVAIVLLLRGIRAAHLRIAGLVLIGVSLAKLFLFDLATLDGVARVIAFLCVGLVLLATGVRYARLVSADQRAGNQQAGNPHAGNQPGGNPYSGNQPGGNPHGGSTPTGNQPSGTQPPGNQYGQQR